MNRRLLVGAAVTSCALAVVLAALVAVGMRQADSGRPPRNDAPGSTSPAAGLTAQRDATGLPLAPTTSLAERLHSQVFDPRPSPTR